jgi:hypothetical protein
VAFNFAYDDRYVVFLDILGFKGKVAKIDINQALFELLIELPQIVAATRTTTGRVWRLGSNRRIRGTIFRCTTIDRSAAWLSVAI